MARAARDGIASKRVVGEARELLSGTHSLEEGETQRAFNAYPAEPGLAAALSAQTAALLGTAPRLLIEVVHIAVLHGSAMTVLIPDPADPANLAARLRAAPGLLLVAGEEGSAGVIDAVGQEAILVMLGTAARGRVGVVRVRQRAPGRARRRMGGGEVLRRDNPGRRVVRSW